MTESGFTARMVARHRPQTPILAATPHESTRKHLALTWGVQSCPLQEYRDSDELIAAAVQAAISSGEASEGDLIVITGGIPLGIRGRTNFLKVHRLGEPVHLPRQSIEDR